MRVGRAQLAAYGALLALLASAIPALGYAGVRTLLESRDGEVVDPVLDPTEPGYQALVPPSATLAVTYTGPDGQLAGAAVLALLGEETPGGSVLLVPAETFVEVTDLGEFTLAYVQALNGPEGTRSLLEWVLRMAVDDVVNLDLQGWVELLAPFGGLVLWNPDELRSEEGAIAYPAGELLLDPMEVGLFAAFLEPDESPLNRLLRQELIWQGILAAITREPASLSLGGEQDRGLARFLPAMAAGTSRIEVLPVQPPLTTGGADQPVLLRPDEAAIDRLVPQLVPFPAGAKPGDRPLVKLLDTAGASERILPAARRVAGAGGQVVMIGNADAFGDGPTEVLYRDEEVRDAAEAVALALGVASVSRVDQMDDSADIVVMLGIDFHQAS